MSPSATGESNLPVQLTRLVGRGRELGEVEQLLEAYRLVTITGAGGSGKTRMAIELGARSALETVWVDFTAILESQLVAEHVAALLGVRQGSSASTTALVLSALRDRRCLLVLDNCEHIVEGASALVDAILRGCPAVRVLATSREALGIGGEIAWLLPALSLPAPDAERVGALADSEAVELFVTRARESLASFDLCDANAGAVARICRRLDGLPLAIELAAARVSVLAPQQIAERLVDRFALLTSRSRSALPRHRTLHEVIAWSYNALSDVERIVLQRLSVFVGDFSLESIEAVCGDDGVEREHILDLMTSLVSKSLVMVDTSRREARYRLLETVHQFAADRLREAGGAEPVRRRHADHYGAAAIAREPDIFGGGSDPAHAAWYEAELGQLRAAAEWFDQAPDGADAALRLATTLEWFWFVRGRFPEGRRWLESALRRRDEAGPLSSGRALAALGLLAFSQADLAVHAEASMAAVSILRELDCRPALAHALSVAGVAAGMEGDVALATALNEQAVEATRGSSSPEIVTVLALRGSACAAAGDYGAARSVWEEAVALAQVHGIRHAEPHLNDGLGRMAFADRDYAAARQYFQRTLEIEVDNPWCRALAVQGQAAIAILDDDSERGARLLGAAAAIRRRIAAPPRPDEADYLEALQSSCRAGLGEASFTAAWDLGATMDLGQALEFARSGRASPARVDRAVRPAAEPVQVADPTSSADLAVRALGPVEVWRAGTIIPPDSWIHGKPKELLIYLLCHPAGRTREQVGLDFWPDSTTAQVRNSFHVLMHRLRRGLENPDMIRLEDGRYGIDPGLDVWFDAAEFERELASAVRHEAAADDPVRRMKEVLALYRGDFLDGDPVGDWHLETRDHLRRLYIDGLSRLADLQVQAGDMEGAVATLEGLVRKEGLSEHAVRRLMRCLGDSGHRDQALRHYTRLAARLSEELDVEPELETRELAARMRG